MTNNVGYYGLLPAKVRYDEDLVANAKLLYSEITALCNREGYCWATNEYFANLYNVNEKTISRWIKQLKTKGFIDYELKTFRYNDGTVKQMRFIFIVGNLQNQTYNFVSDQSNNFMPDQMDNFVLDQSNNFVTHNNTNNNIIKEKRSKKFIPPSIEEIEEYCKERNNNVDPEKFKNYYDALGWVIGKNKPIKDWRACVRTWEKNSYNSTQTRLKGQELEFGVYQF